MALFDLLGRTWSMGVVWQLASGPLTFRALQRRCDGMSASLLNNRLRELRETGLVDRCEEGYVLTELGRELSALLQGMGEWSIRWAEVLASQEGGDS
ncbi:MAG: helix-turn-helix transcriptional regulator [Myxococcales bacterium]|nr:helix-turn-helix transcriptional regulator [Myxococcales bacterium]